MSGLTFQQCHVMGYLTNLKWKAKKYRVSLKKLDLRLELSLRFSGASDQKSLEGWPPKSNLIEKIKVKN